MIPEIGHFILILALCVAGLLGTLPLLGAHYGRREWLVLARPAAQMFFPLVAASFVALAWSFYVNDFSVAYVAANSNSLLPTMYRLAAVWGGHEGSLLLWVLLLSGWTFAVAQLSRTLDEAMVARVLGVLGLVSTGLLLFLLFTSNPFDRLLPAPQNGRDLNPMLQDPGLVFHPPMLYMGYVGFSVAFAFAIAALLSGRLDAAWARWSRPWTTTAWVFLTLGIALGSWWAYYTLGWGGWWFWDPVENASFMPWLVGTALMHSLAVTEKRGSFRNWTVLLAISAFSLSLLGTFLVRSGVLTSVHAFANDPRRGVFILLLLVLVVGSSLTLFAWRAPKVALGGSFALMSRESLLLAGNLLLVVACGSVLLGTLYPLILDALGLGKISVGAPYFNTVFVPLMAPMLFLMAAAPLAGWKHAELRQMTRELWIAGVLAVIAAVAIPTLMGGWTLLTAVGALLSVWVGTSMIVQTIKQLKSGVPPVSFWGMQLGHLGVAVFVIGVTLVGGYQDERDVRMEPGDTVGVGGHEFKLLGVTQIQGPNYTAQRGQFEVRRGGRLSSTLRPEKRAYMFSAMPMTIAAIDSGFTRDVYVSLAEPLEGRAWAVRVYYKPFVGWIWGGCLLMALGGLCAVSDRRYRLRVRASSRVQFNAAIYRDQLLTLDQEFNQSRLGQLDYAQGRTELQRRLLEDSHSEDAPPTVRSPRKTLIGVGLVLPCIACAFYLVIGNPAALQPGAAGNEQTANSQDLEKMTATLAAQLESDPTNYPAWSMLARSYQAMGRTAEAEKAFERAGSFIDGDAEMLASYADVSAANAGGSFAGKPAQLIDKALKADPHNGLALWLSGTADLQARNYAKAVLTWQKLAALLPPGSDNARMLQVSIDNVRTKSGLAPQRQ